MVELQITLYVSYTTNFLFPTDDSNLDMIMDLMSEHIRFIEHHLNTPHGALNVNFKCSSIENVEHNGFTTYAYTILPDDVIEKYIPYLQNLTHHLLQFPDKIDVPDFGTISNMKIKSATIYAENNGEYYHIS